MTENLEKTPKNADFRGKQPGNIEIGIVAHQARKDAAERLFETLDAKVISLDDGRLKCEGNHQEVLRLLAGYPSRYQADWLTILEDDAVPVHDFRRHVTAALEYAPAPVVGWYLGVGNPSGETQRQIKQAVEAAEQSGRAWIMADCLIGSVSYSVRTDLVDDMLSFICDRDDELPLRITRWTQDRGHDICYSTPSLVDHADGEPIGRWRGPNFLPRRARSFGTRESWDTGWVRLGYCPWWSVPHA